MSVSRGRLALIASSAFPQKFLSCFASRTSAAAWRRAWVLLLATGLGAVWALAATPPATIQSPTALAIETSGATALVVDNSRLLRISLADFSVQSILASSLPAPVTALAIEAGGATVLVTAQGNSLLRVKLADGTYTTITSSLSVAQGLAIESGGKTVLVTDCGGDPSCQSGRVARVTLSNGTITPITPVSLGLAYPEGIAIEAGGATVLVAVKEASSGGQTAGQIYRVTLSSGGAQAIANVPSPTSIAIESGGTTALVGSTFRIRGRCGE